MKIVLAGINSKFIHSNLAVRYLKAYTRDIDYNCVIREFSINDRKEKITEELIGENPDIIAFSCYIWNVEYITYIANLIKLINEDIEILVGGPEASYDSREFLIKNNVDYVIEGEGEETFREFVKEKLVEPKSKMVSLITGLYTKNGDTIYYGGARQPLDMEKLIFPYDYSDNLDNKIIYYESSRGCPFKCAYCLSSTQHGVRFQDIERVKKELDYFINKRVRLVKFVDRTFNCNAEFATNVWKFLINKDTDTVFHFEISGDLLSKEQLNLLSKAPKGRFQFEVGVQTTNNEVLRNIDRFVSFADISEKVIELEKMKNIQQHLDLIAGLPDEDFESFKKSFNDVYSISPDVIQLGFLKLLKGSKMRNEAQKWGMIYSPYAPYEILKTSVLSYDEIVSIKRVEEIFDKYYNSNKFKTILKYFVTFYKTPFDFYNMLGKFYYAKGYYNRNISSADYYNVFIEFNDEVLKSDKESVNEIVKYEYLLYNRKRWLPEFIERYVDKKTETKIKDILKKQEFKNINNVHIEIFKIDILKFIDDGTIVKGDYIMLFHESGMCIRLDI